MSQLLVFYLLSFRRKDCLHLLKHIFNRLCGMNLKPSIRKQQNFVTTCNFWTVIQSKTRRKKDFHLANFPFSFVVLNHRQARFKKHLETLPYSLDVVILSPLQQQKWRQRSIHICDESIERLK